MCGVKLDLSGIKLPTFILASREDHIVPWKTAYQTTQLVGGDITFVRAASGHIAGVINPPAQNRRLYWENPELPQDADQWLAQAREHPGSWWNQWSDWLRQHGGKRVRSRKKLGSLTHQPLEPAPGRYVRAKAPGGGGTAAAGAGGRS
jgi:polyhydroxyalkanoate synthase